MNKKSVYFAVQVIGSAILSAIIWFLIAKAAFAIYGSGDAWFFSVLLFGGIGIYIALTVAYIIFGYKKLSDWRPWAAIVSVLISLVVGFLGGYGINLIEFLNRSLNKKPESVSIIGGADGPTTAFIAGELARPLVGLMVVAVILVIAGMILFMFKRKNDKE